MSVSWSVRTNKDGFHSLFHGMLSRWQAKTSAPEACLIFGTVHACSPQPCLSIIENFDQKPTQIPIYRAHLCFLALEVVFFWGSMLNTKIETHWTTFKCRIQEMVVVYLVWDEKNPHMLQTYRVSENSVSWIFTHMPPKCHQFSPPPQL